MIIRGHGECGSDPPWQCISGVGLDTPEKCADGPWRASHAPGCRENTQTDTTLAHDLAPLLSRRDLWEAAGGWRVKS